MSCETVLHFKKKYSSPVDQILVLKHHICIPWMNKNLHQCIITHGHDHDNMNKTQNTSLKFYIFLNASALSGQRVTKKALYDLV